jgi:pyruvate dehydrogenase E2 component (dihydrolipoamide acetyltransferase)
MGTEVVMPRMGETVHEGTVNTWFKRVGDPVAEGEPLLEIGTDKVDAEIPAPAAGVLAEIRVAEGQTVPVATVLAVIS